MPMLDCILVKVTTRQPDVGCRVHVVTASQLKSQSQCSLPCRYWNQNAMSFTVSSQWWQKAEFQQTLKPIAQGDNQICKGDIYRTLHQQLQCFKDTCWYCRACAEWRWWCMVQLLDAMKEEQWMLPCFPQWSLNHHWCAQPEAAASQHGQQHIVDVWFMTSPPFMQCLTLLTQCRMSHLHFAINSSALHYGCCQSVCKLHNPQTAEPTWSAIEKPCMHKCRPDMLQDMLLGIKIHHKNVSKKMHFLGWADTWWHVAH